MAKKILKAKCPACNLTFYTENLNQIRCPSCSSKMTLHFLETDLTINEISNKLNAPSKFKLDFKVHYPFKTLRSKSRRVSHLKYISGLTLVLTRIHRLPILIDDILNLFNIKQKRLIANGKDISSKLDLPYLPAKPKILTPRLLELLNLPSSFEKEVNSLISKFKAKINTTHSPKVLSSVCIYALSLQKGYLYNKNYLSNKTGVNTTSIRQVLNKIKESLNLDIPNTTKLKNYTTPTKSNRFKIK